MKLVLLACGAAAALLAAGPAASKSNRSVVVGHAKVSAADLDLRSEAGAAAMLARIEEGAGKACGGDPGTAFNRDIVTLLKQRAYRECKTAAIEATTIRLGAPLVRSTWLSRGEPIKYAINSD
jgi:UrcA family protein